jgi:hypothetical protein
MANKTPHQQLLDQNHRNAVQSLNRSVIEARLAVKFAEEAGLGDLAGRIEERAGQLEQLHMDLRRIQIQSIASENEPFEAPIFNFNDHCSIGGLDLERWVVVDLKLATGHYLRTTVDHERVAGSVTLSAMHLNFPVLARRPEGVVEVRLPVPQSAVARWVRALTAEERQRGRRPPLGSVAHPPADAQLLKLDHRTRYEETDMVGDKALEEGERIEVFMVDGVPLPGTWETERKSYGRHVRVGLLRFEVEARREVDRVVYLPLVEDDILVRRRP